jgi:YtkA-like
VKIAATLLCASALLLAQQPPPEGEGNFGIRFEPTAKLQTGVQVPFRITVTNNLRNPLTDAKVTLQISMTDDTRLQVFPAPATGPGVYVAKPIFPVSGEWNLYVEVRRRDRMSSRAIQFSVPE